MLSLPSQVLLNMFLLKFSAILSGQRSILSAIFSGTQLGCRDWVWSLGDLLGNGRLPSPSPWKRYGGLCSGPGSCWALGYFTKDQGKATKTRRFRLSVQVTALKFLIHLGYFSHVFRHEQQFMSSPCKPAALINSFYQVWPSFARGGSLVFEATPFQLPCNAWKRGDASCFSGNADNSCSVNMPVNALHSGKDTAGMILERFYRARAFAVAKIMGVSREERLGGIKSPKTCVSKTCGLD